MYKHPASAAASRVFLLSNLDWFWSSKHQNNCSHISRWTLTGLKQLSFTWFSVNLFFLEKSVRLKSDHQDLLRNVCFQKLYFHCSSAEEWSSSHIFWGAFIIHLSIIIGLHCIICLDHFSLILRRHIIGDIAWRLIVSALLLYRSLWLTLQASEFHHINISICTKLHIFAHFDSLNKTAVFPPYYHYIRLYEP